MGWSPSVLFGFLLPAFGARHVPVPIAGDGVTASCDDVVRVTDAVFTGRTGASPGAGGTRDCLGNDTFGPDALLVGASTRPPTSPAVAGSTDARDGTALAPERGSELQALPTDPALHLARERAGAEQCCPG